MSALPNPLPDGCEVLDLDDLLERSQLAAADADEAMAAASTFIKAGLAGATAGGIVLGAADLRALTWMLDLVKGRTKAAHEAALNVALARLQGVQ